MAYADILATAEREGLAMHSLVKRLGVVAETFYAWWRKRRGYLAAEAPRREKLKQARLWVFVNPEVPGVVFRFIMGPTSSGDNYPDIRGYLEDVLVCVRETEPEGIGDLAPDRWGSERSSADRGLVGPRLSTHRATARATVPALSAVGR